MKSPLVTEKILERDPMEEIRKAFKLFDDDGTGKISLRNLRRVAKEIGENIDDEELQAMIDEFDLDQDGEINEQEFISIMTENDDSRWSRPVPNCFFNVHDPWRPSVWNGIP